MLSINLYICCPFFCFSYIDISMNNSNQVKRQGAGVIPAVKSPVLIDCSYTGRQKCLPKNNANSREQICSRLKAFYKVFYGYFIGIVRNYTIKQIMSNHGKIRIIITAENKFLDLKPKTQLHLY